MAQSYIARSASDRTDDWPAWMVIDASSGLNVTSKAAKIIGVDWKPGAVFTSRKVAESIANLANERIAS